MQYTIVLESELPLEIASQIYYCYVQFVMEVILRIEDCSFGIWKRLLEILVDQSVIYQRLFLIWNMEVMNILHFYKYKIMNNNKNTAFLIHTLKRLFCIGLKTLTNSKIM